MAKQLRIIAGKLRGKKIHSVPGLLTRPTSDRVREAIFNILGGSVVAARVLDLFSGTGALGIEAFSRGAQAVVFVDHHPDPLAVLRKNIEACRLGDQALILRQDLQKPFGWPQLTGKTFDLVLMDPPYDQGFIKPTLERLHHSGLLEKGAVIVAEHSSLEPVSESIFPFELRDQRRYGKPLVSFFVYAV